MYQVASQCFAFPPVPPRCATVYGTMKKTAQGSAERTLCVTAQPEEPLRLESLEDGAYLVPHRCRCQISEKGKPTVELELYYAAGALHPRSVTVTYDPDDNEIRAGDLRLPLNTYLRLAILTVAYEEQPFPGTRSVGLMPVAPGGEASWFRLRGADITPIHYGDWDEELTARADQAIRLSDRRTRRPHARLNDTQRQERLERVAAIYLAAAETGKPPIKTIMEEEYVSRPTAARLVSEARERGLLPPANGPHGWRELQARAHEENDT
jgi:Family of unknown function (DUF6214)